MPEFRVWVYARSEFDTEERAGDLMAYIMAHRRFAPDRYGTHEPLRRLTADRVANAIDLLVNRAAQSLRPDRVLSMLLLARSRPARCSFRVAWSRLPHRAFEMSSYTIEEEPVRDEAVLADWVELTLGLIDLHKAWYALFALESETHEKNFMTWHTQHPGAADPAKGVGTGRGVGLDLEEGVPGLYWGNYFGPFYVKWFGREKFESLPCVEKRWLNTGGIFFTTATTPFEWNTSESYQLQYRARQHLGSDAFFDIHSVREAVSQLEPIPESIKPELFQVARRVPVFPFEIKPPPGKSWDEQVEDARYHFEARGFTFEDFEKGVLTFRDATGGTMRIMLKPERRLEYWPTQ